jgi:hypothetical protein
MARPLKGLDIEHNDLGFRPSVSGGLACVISHAFWSIG